MYRSRYASESMDEKTIYLKMFYFSNSTIKYAIWLRLTDTNCLHLWNVNSMCFCRKNQLIYFKCKIIPCELPPFNFTHEIKIFNFQKNALWLLKCLIQIKMLPAQSVNRGLERQDVTMVVCHATHAGHSFEGTRRGRSCPSARPRRVAWSTPPSGNNVLLADIKSV